MDTSLNSELQTYSQWRSSLKNAVTALSEFITTHRVADLRSMQAFETVQGSIADDNLSVAFVAEYSRGKSETINTLFFGDHRQRILPTGTGRTTMCPAEIAYDKNKPSGISFLPIETRQHDTPLFELKKDKSLWEHRYFDESNSTELVEALGGMAQNKLVSKEYALKLGFELKSGDTSQLSDDGEHGLPINKFDEVEIPSWRHAIINLPHPLLEKGLVVLDTPGLNAIGAEPELTVNQLGTAHTVVFLLAIDTGVTQSDLDLWKEQLIKKDTQNILIALNKIDSLWDGIRSEEEVEIEIEKQVSRTAEILQIDRSNIFPISAQKGLLGKVQAKQDLVEKSRVLELEQAIGERLIPAKKQIVSGVLNKQLSVLTENAKTVFSGRIRDMEEHIAELKQISVKNTDVIADIMLKAQAEKELLEDDMKRYHVLQSVYNKESNKLLKMLSPQRLEKLIARTTRNMKKAASSITLQKIINTYFDKLGQYFEEATAQATEITHLAERINADFEEEHGIEGIKIDRLRLEKYREELDKLKLSESYLATTRTMIFREQMSITKRFYETACTTSRSIFAKSLNDCTEWKNTLMIPIESHVREHHTQLRRRMESVRRIHQATDTVEQRLVELKTNLQSLQLQNAELDKLCGAVYELVSQPPYQEAGKVEETANTGSARPGELYLVEPLKIPGSN
jgi:hypothetical protein